MKTNVKSYCLILLYSRVGAEDIGPTKKKLRNTAKSIRIFFHSVKIVSKVVFL